MKTSTFKMFREENGVTKIDLVVNREGDVFNISEAVKGIDKKEISLDELNSEFIKIGAVEEGIQLSTNVEGEEINIEVNDDLLDELNDFFEFISEVVDRVKKIEEK